MVNNYSIPKVTLDITMGVYESTNEVIFLSIIFLILKSFHLFLPENYIKITIIIISHDDIHRN